MLLLFVLFFVFNLFFAGEEGDRCKGEHEENRFFGKKMQTTMHWKLLHNFFARTFVQLRGLYVGMWQKDIHPRSRRFMNVFSKIAMLVIFYSHFSGKKPVACAWDVIKTMAAFVKDDCWYSRLHLQFNYTTVFDLQVNLKMMPLSSHHIVYLVISQNWMGYIASLTAHFDNGRW